MPHRTLLSRGRHEPGNRPDADDRPSGPLFESDERVHVGNRDGHPCLAFGSVVARPIPAPPPPITRVADILESLAGYCTRINDSGG